VQAQHFIYALRLGGDDDDGDVFGFLVRFELLVYFPTVHVRHHQIEQDEIGFVVVDHLQPFHAAVRALDLKAFATQNQPHEINHFGFVFHAQDTLEFGVHYDYRKEVYHKVRSVKIITWNINGLRAALRKNALAWVWDQDPDLLCLQEVKARPDQLTDEQKKSLRLPYIWNPAERPGYSGVTTFHKEEPLEIQLGMNDPRFDVEGRLISTLHAGFRLFNVYFPSGTRGKTRVDYKLEFYARLLKLCDRRHKRGENLIVTGDFNTAHQPIDLRNPKSNQKTSGFLPEERAWVQKYLDHGFVDIYRRLYPDRVQYTWWTNILNSRQRGVGWRIDYFLVSEALVSRVKDAVIHDGVLGSDHCPVELVLE